MTYLWELLIDLLETVLLFVLTSHKLISRKLSHYSTRMTAAVLFLAAVIFVSNYAELPYLITTAILAISRLLLLLYLYHDRFISIAFWLIVYSIIELTADSLITIIPNYIFNCDLNSLLFNGEFRFYSTLIYILIISLFVSILLLIRPRSFYITSVQQTIFLIISVLCLAIESIIEFAQVYTDSELSVYKILYVLFFLVLLIYICFTFFVYKLGIEQDKTIKLAEINTLEKTELKQYKEIESSVLELRYLKHDLTNHLETIKKMIAQENTDDLKQYVNNLAVDVSSASIMVSSGITSLDCIITTKLRTCKKDDIHVDYSLCLPDGIPLTDVEFCSLIGNLFDNAINACNMLTENKYITLFIKPYKDMLSIFMKNSSNGNYPKNIHHPTHTPYSTDHGLGLNRIHSILKKYNSLINIEPESDLFSVSILIPLMYSED